MKKISFSLGLAEGKGNRFRFLSAWPKENEIDLGSLFASELAMDVRRVRNISLDLFLGMLVMIVQHLALASKMG